MSVMLRGVDCGGGARAMLSGAGTRGGVCRLVLVSANAGCCGITRRALAKVRRRMGPVLHAPWSPLRTGRSAG